MTDKRAKVPGPDLYPERVDSIEELHEACEERLEVSGGSNG